MCLAWLVKWFEERGNATVDTRITWRTPLVVPTLIMVIVYMISTALSVAPRTSLLGSYQRLQGTYTTFSYIVVFFMVLQGLRTRAQLERLLTVMILNSFPIATYGLLQRLRIDPLPWGGDTVERVAGNMGNSIFIAAYLIMTFFVTVYKIVDAFVSIFKAAQTRITFGARRSGQIAGVGGIAQANRGGVSLIRAAQKLRQARGASDQHNQNSSGKRVERAGVSSAFFPQDAPYPRHHVVRGQAGGFVYDKKSVHFLTQ